MAVQYMKLFTRLIPSISERVAAWQLLVARYVTAALVVTIAYGVVLRYVFREGAPWTVELPGLLFLTITAFALGYAQLQRRHVMVEFLVSRLPPRARKAAEVFSYLIFFTFCLLLLRASAAKMLSDWVIRTEAARIPLFPFYITLLIGLGSLMLQLLVDVAKAVAGFRPKAEKDGTDRLVSIAPTTGSE